MMSLKRLKCFFWLASIIWIHASTAFAQIVADGSLGGPAGALTGPNFDINADLGRIEGSNLFHSFSEFNLANGESATFSGPTSIANILSRVTGNNPSNIDGLMRSTIDGANLYFLNPNGVFFGTNAQIDVSGSFVVSTADYLKLQDGGRFNGSLDAVDVLTSAPPSAFGFSKADAAPIRIVGNEIVVAEKQSFAAVGGDITIDGAEIKVPGGHAHITSVAFVGEVVLDVTDPEAISDISGFDELGDIAMTGSTIDVSSAPAGRVVVRSENLQMSASLIESTTFGDTDVNGLGIDIDITGELRMENAEILSNTEGNGNAGDILINASQVLLDGTETQIGSHVGQVFGNGGTIQLGGDNLSSVIVRNGAYIFTSTNGFGNAGDILIFGESESFSSLILDGSRISSETLQKPIELLLNISHTYDQDVNAFLTNPDGDSISLFSGVGGDGDNFTDTILKDRRSIPINNGSAPFTGEFRPDGSLFSLTNGELNGEWTLRLEDTFPSLDDGRLNNWAITFNHDQTFTNTTSQGFGGVNPALPANIDSVIEVSGVPLIVHPTGNAGSIVISGMSEINFFGDSLIRSLTTNNSLGDAGNVIITNIDSLLLEENSTILSGTAFFSKGNSGNILLNEIAEVLLVKDSSILSNTIRNSLGDAGNITITEVGSLLLEGSFISSGTSSFSAGNAGDIMIMDIGSLSLKNDSEILSDTTRSEGNGGKIEMTNIKNLSLEDGSQILSSTFLFSKGDAGEIIITDIGNISLKDESQILSNTLLLSEGDAGVITVKNINSLSLENDSDILSDTNTFSKGDSKDIIITDVYSLSLQNDSKISSESSTSSEGDAGDIVMTNINNISLKNDSQFSSQTFESSTGNAGDININGVSSLLLQDNSKILSGTTSSEGDAGNVTIANAFNITLQENSKVLASAIKSKGGAGNIMIADVGSLSSSKSVISTSTQESEGNAGDIRIMNVRSLFLKDSNIFSNTSFLSEGNAGDIMIVNISNIWMQEGSFISSSSLNSKGYSGKVNFNRIEEINLYNSSIFTEVIGSSIVEDDTIDISLGTVEIDEIQSVTLNRSFISAETNSNIPGGKILIDNVDKFLLENVSGVSSASTGYNGGAAGAIEISVTDSINVIENSSITTRATDANGGNIEITTGSTVILEDSQIATSAQSADGTISYDKGNGGGIRIETVDRFEMVNSELSAEAFNNGGNIDIDPFLILVNQSEMNASAINGTGGNITLVADVFLPSADSTFDASSEFGVSGSVDVQAPDTDLIGSLVVLPESLLDADSQLPERCAVKLDGNYSSMIVVGRGGVPVAPGDLLPAYPISSGDLGEESDAEIK